MIDKKNMILNHKSVTLEELFQEVTTKLENTKYINDKESVINDLRKREDIASTLFESGVAIPHASSSQIKETTLYLVTSKASY